jgi:hypothetical protein
MDIVMTIQDLMKKYGIETGFENDEALLKDFIKELDLIVTEATQAAYTEGYIACSRDALKGEINWFNTLGYIKKAKL